MAWFAPYRVQLLHEISKSKDIDLTVIFCSAIESGRAWSVPEKLPFKAIFLKSRTLLHYRYRYKAGEKNTIRYPVGLYHALRLTKSDVVVAYEFRLECVLASVFSLFLKFFYITWSDVTQNHDERMGKIRMVIRKLLLKRSKALIGSSSETLDYFQHVFEFPVERSFLSILSAHIDEFQKSVPSVSYLKKNSNRIIRFLYVGRLIQLKGVDLLITAFSKVINKFPDAVLTIVGDGSERESLEELAENLGCSSEVIFKGNIPHTQLPQEMINHDIFVFPTRLDVFGLVVAEAIACGLPVLCSCYAGAARDLVRDNGIIVNPTKSKELILAMERLASDSNLRLRMHNASKSILQKHNLSSAVQGFSDAIRSVVS